MAGDGPAGGDGRWARVEAVGKASSADVERSEDDRGSKPESPRSRSAAERKAAERKAAGQDTAGRESGGSKGRSSRGSRPDQGGSGRPQRGGDRVGSGRGRAQSRPDRGTPNRPSAAGKPKRSTEGRPQRPGKDAERSERPRRGGDQRVGIDRRASVGAGTQGRRRRGAAPREERDGAFSTGPRLASKQDRKPEPAIDEDVTGFEIDRAVKNELRTLSKDNAKGVGQHLVMVARLLDVDVPAARAHAETAVRRAGRVAAVRETRGLVAYREGDYQTALSEFRTARRLSGSQHLLPLMVDCERGLGRPERALELAGSPEARTLGRAERLELLMVCSGIRRDMGDFDAAVVLLETPELHPNRREPWSARLFYAYADALLARGDAELARAWFAEAADADTEGLTDAAERLDELDGVVFVDLDHSDGDETTVAGSGGTTVAGSGGEAGAGHPDGEAHPEREAGGAVGAGAGAAEPGHGSP